MSYVDQAIAHLRSEGCAVNPGVFSLHLPWLREALNSILGFEMDNDLWQLIQRTVEQQFPGFVLANDTANNGGWTTDWYFTNDPEKITGHNEADLKTSLTRLRNSLRRMKTAQSSPYLAGTFGVVGETFADFLLELVRQAPQMLRDVDNGIISPVSGHHAAREISKRLDDIVDDGYEAIGEQVFAYAQSRGTAATSTPTPAPKSKRKRSASGTP